MTPEYGNKRAEAMTLMAAIITPLDWLVIVGYFALLASVVMTGLGLG